MSLEPGAIIAWIIVGLIAGWMTGKAVKRRGSGAFGDLILGIVGVFVGGIVVDVFGIQGRAGFVDDMVIAFVGTIILVGCGPGSPRPRGAHAVNLPAHLGPCTKELLQAL